jgi:Dam-replacing family.
MNLHFNTKLATSYKSNSQKIRILSEDWVAKNLFCPICGNPILQHYKANRPVADFYCNNCKADYELKSKESSKNFLEKKILDGAYNTMIERITSIQNPNFFFMTYCNNSVNNFILIPNHFFTTSIIEKRKPLSSEARRAGWIGCNINISDIPESGKIYIVKNNKEIDHNIVITNYKKVETLHTNDLKTRKWIMDILKCIDKIQEDNFSLNQMYAFENILKTQHPNNNHIKDKIRQQLQKLRDIGFLEFTTKGNYKIIKNQ